MKRQLIILLITATISITLLPTVFGQANSKLLYVAGDVLLGVGKYNAIDYGAGVNIRLHYPILPQLAVTAKAGIEYYFISAYRYMTTTYLGYGYNPISGFGFNTLYSAPGGVSGEKTYGVSIPLAVGPRLYLPALRNGAHVDLNVGADLAASRIMVTSLHVSPGAGITLPLPNDKLLDVMAYYVTSFERGSGVIGVSVAYGLPVKF
ncbi:hypothetical protein IC229_25715 [Spirosoma sp. BT702]|uniref:Uncharacterized protein n=1 Tax=Spirosoma profusum TaxID=2771354 RepID=A0A927APD2_9BACT|nr:hypothetical protein [Spirosoma profusum]MBD2704069.1 hypothetical protein [Spirosoma profusum]